MLRQAKGVQYATETGTVHRGTTSAGPEYAIPGATLPGALCCSRVFHDGTNRRKAEESLCDRCWLLRTLVEGTTDAVFVKDLQGRYLFANGAVARIIGRPLEEIIGAADSMLFPSATARRLMADDGRVMSDGRARLLEAQIPVAGEPRTFLSTKAVFRNHEGRIIGLFGISRDITERRTAQAAARDSEQRLAQVLQSTMDAIVTMDEQRVVTFFNRAAEHVFRCAAKDAIGRPFDRFASAELLTSVVQCQDDSNRGRSSKRYAWAPDGLTAKRADGETFAIEATLSRAVAAGNDLYTLILRDISERQRAEEEFHKAARAGCLCGQAAAGFSTGRIVGDSESLKRLIKTTAQVARTDSTVLITGETGVGKELVARAIHHASPRRDRTLVKVNCAALPHGLIESELFGHERGAFTGAVARKVGRFELADGGTLLLDEVGDLPGDLQAKLLRALESGEFERVGGTDTIKVDVRVIAATNRKLAEAVEQQQFRADLYYRLNVFPIYVPPLRDRREDIKRLVEHFVAKFSARMGKCIKTIPESTIAALQAYAWPGNVRELENVIERSVVLSCGSRLDLGDWPPGSIGSQAPQPSLALVDVERRHIKQVLESTGWRVSGEKGAAKLLGIKPTTLESRMRRLGIARPG